MKKKELVLINTKRLIFGNTKTNPKVVEEIAKQIDPKKFKALPAYFNGKGYILTDGNHRAKAAIRAGDTHVPAVLLTKEEFDFVKFSSRTIDFMVYTPERIKVYQ